jgi:lipoprotein-anchoring transpeptidase ErfK/SrfK
MVCLSSLRATDADLPKYLGEAITIEVDTQRQQVQIFEGGLLIKEMDCSSGKAETPTPSGTFQTHKKALSLALDVDGEKISYYFYTGFNGGIGLHSGIFGDHPMVEEGERLFQAREASSQGCVRLRLNDAQWIYENIGLGATVEVY